MSQTTTPDAPKAPTVNRIGLPKAGYEGGKSTLCAGCGHDVITKQIVTAFWEMGIDPARVAKFSGIGCSSKTPAYFLGRSHGFNGVHGRMPALATGAALANRTLVNIGVSGDGDTASIGMGQFVHMVRRNVECVYIVEDNGVYGLTKGQFSATADEGAKLKTGAINELPPVDICALAIELGCGFVARAFSGDTKRLQAILKAAIAHQGLAVIDVISPCVTFNDHEGSTKSYKYTRDHEEPLHDIGFVPFFEETIAEIPEGETRNVEFPDGSVVRFRALGRDYDPTDRGRALALLHESHAKKELLTGIFHLAPAAPGLTSMLNLVDEPLATLPIERVRPPKSALETIMDRLK